MIVNQWVRSGGAADPAFMKYLRRGSGYYIDVGASQLVIDGKIKLKTGQVERLTETGVVLADGSELPADLVVYATGYGSMNGWAADLIGQDVADRVGKVWGLGSDTRKDPGPWEGEQRNMWKPTQQPGLWFHGGNLHQSRHYSQVPGAAAQGPRARPADPGLGDARRAPHRLSPKAQSGPRGYCTTDSACRCRDPARASRTVPAT
jgi:cation diffusion facilitator CzcD-associated flavoprotein CzcO